MPIDRRIMITVLKCIVQHLQIALCYFLRESQVNETYAPSYSLSTVCVYEVIEIYIAYNQAKNKQTFQQLSPL